MTHSVFENNLETAIHEIIHGLGFIDDYFSSYYDSVTGEDYNTSNSYTVQKVIYLSTPRVTNFLQYHFNCTTAKGMQMENNGGSGTQGSHFERSLFYNEIMTGSDMTGNFLITDFTFELLQDTGFYRVSDYSPDKPLWGKNKGCDFVNQQCLGGNFSEFCTGDKITNCSFYLTGVSKCISEQLSGSCKYFYIQSNYDCRDPDNIESQSSSGLLQYFGSDSICVSGSVSKSQLKTSDYSCVQYKCDVNNTLVLLVDGLEFNCSKQEAIKLPEQYYGNIKCPSDSQQFCQNVDECPNSCSSKGFCINKECICMLGYSSKDCNTQCTQYRYKGSCLEKCPESTFVNENIKYCVGCPANCETCTNYNKCSICKPGYVLRGGFCDNYQLIELLKIVESNSTSTNTTDTNTSSTNSTNTTNTSTNTTNTSTNTTNTSTNTTNTSTNTSTNKTDTQDQSSNSTDSSNSNNSNEYINQNQTESTDSDDSDDNKISIAAKDTSIYLINLYLLTLNW